MRPAVLAVLLASLTVACHGEPKKMATRTTPVSADRQRPIILDPAASEVVSRAYHHGPDVPPQVTHLPCKARPNAPTSIVEAVIDESGKVVQATVVAGEHDAQVDSIVRSCFQEARISPARMKGRPVAVFFNLTISSRG